MVDQDRVEAHEVEGEPGQRRGERARREQGQEPEGRQERPEVHQLLDGDDDGEPAPGPERERHEDVPQRGTEVPVPVQVRVRAPAEVRHDPRDVRKQDGDGERRKEPPGEPAPAREREQDPEAHHRDGAVLAAPEGQRQGRRAPAVAPRVERQRGGDHQRDRERLGVDVAQVDAVERRVDEVQQCQADGGLLGAGARAEAPRGQAVERDRSTGEDQRLRDHERGPAGCPPTERRQQVEHRREVVAPGVHRRQRDVRPVARGDRPDDLHVVAEVEGVGAERQVPRHDDEPHRQRVDGDTDRHGASRPHRRQRHGRHEEPERDEADQQQDEILGARQREPADDPAPRHEDRHAQADDRARHHLERAGERPHGSLWYLARRLSKRRERRRPFRCSVYQKRTARIRRP